MTGAYFRYAAGIGDEG